MTRPDSEQKLYYLASPYSSPNRITKTLRYYKALEFGSNLKKSGFHLLEPIATSHVAAKEYGLPTGYEYWKERDRLWISRCDGVIVCQMQGWQDSEGVTDEINYAKELGLPVYLVDEDLVFYLLSSAKDPDPEFEPVEPLGT